VTKDTNKNEIAQALLQTSDLGHLGSVALVEMANAAQIQELEQGTLLLAEEFISKHVYLLSGEVVISADGKTIQHIESGTARARTPLFRIHTHGLVAKCLTSVRLLSIDEAIVNRYVASIHPKDTDGIQVEDYVDRSQESSILAGIRHVFDHSEVDLPSLPETAMRIQRAVNDPERNLDEMAMELQADPIIAARVVQVANSAMYFPSPRVVSLQQAVSRIGLKALQTIVASVVLRNLFRPKSTLLHKRASSFYTHSIRVAAVCYILARHLKGFDPDRAFLAGLLHDIGVMPILIMADGRHDLTANPELLEIIIHDLTGTAGSMLLRQWGFDEELQTVAKEAQMWQRHVATADYCDLVQVAQLHCQHVGGHKVDAPPLIEIPAFSRLHLDKIDPVNIIHEARDEIHDIVNMLKH